MAAGAALALAGLIGLSFLMLSTEAATAKVLVAIWLWLLPALGSGAALGWFSAEIVIRGGRRSR